MLRMRADIRICDTISNNATPSSDFFDGDDALWRGVNKLAHSALCSNISDNILTAINDLAFKSTGDAYQHIDSYGMRSMFFHWRKLLCPLST